MTPIKMRGSDYTTHLFTTPWFVVVIGFLAIIIKQNKEHNTFSFCVVPWVKRKEWIIKMKKTFYRKFGISIIASTLLASQLPAVSALTVISSTGEEYEVSETLQESPGNNNFSLPNVSPTYGQYYTNWRVYRWKFWKKLCKLDWQYFSLVC